MKQPIGKANILVIAAEKRNKGGNMLKKILPTLLVFIFAFCMIQAKLPSVGEKIYIDQQEFNVDTLGDAFHIHIGNNQWVLTNTVHRDETGLFSYECNLIRSAANAENQMQVERKWRCPYCFNYWEVGKPCGNRDCPSKYK